MTRSSQRSYARIVVVGSSGSGKSTLARYRAEYAELMTSPEWAHLRRVRLRSRRRVERWLRFSQAT